jgi:hypothetical protein
MPGLYLVYPVLIPYCAWFIPCLFHTYPFLSKLSMPAGHCAHCAPVSFCLGRPLRGPSQGALGCQPQAVFHLSLETHGRTAAKSPSHLLVLPGRYPSHAGILQHLRKTGPARFWSYGRAECAEVLRAHTNTHPLRGPSRQCAGSRAVDALVSPWQRYADQPVRAPKASAQPILILPHGHSPGVGQDGKQLL